VPRLATFYNAGSVILELLIDSTLLTFGHRVERRHGNGCSALSLAVVVWSGLEPKIPTHSAASMARCIPDTPWISL
jgi:hypothetical protein